MCWPVAYVYDPLMAGLERRYGATWRRALLAGLSGRVLEIGAGTGANLDHYPASVEHVVLAEPDGAMRGQLERKLALRSLQRRATVSSAPVEALGDELGTFDAVVSTLVLCTVPDPSAALGAVRTRLVSGGRFVFLEHVAAEDDANALAWQERLDPLWRRVAGGCRLNRRTAATIASAGFEFEQLEREIVPRAPRILKTLVRGVAIR
jgi:SAM-dependent methyltransferase